MILSEREYKYYTKEERSIRSDEVFKIVFGNNYNSEYLKSLLEALLDINITNIAVRNEVALDRSHIGSKLMKLDILAEIDGNSKVNIEMQTSLNYNVIKRGEAYASTIFSNNLSVGEDYIKAPKTIVIWILDFELFKDGPYHEQSKLIRQSNNTELSDDIIYHYIQLPKFIKQTREIKTKKEQWLAYISHQLNKEELEELFEMNDEIKNIDEIAEMVVNNEELRYAIMDKWMAKYERNLERAEAHEAGEKEKAIEIAKKMRDAGKDMKEIIEFTDLTKEEIEKL